MKEDDQFQTYSIELALKLLQKHLGCPDLSMHKVELYTYIQSKPTISQVAIKYQYQIQIMYANYILGTNHPSNREYYRYANGK